MKQRVWLSSRKMTVYVETLNGVIVEASPIIRRFVGQPLQNLERWMTGQGGLRVHKYQNKDGV